MLIVTGSASGRISEVSDTSGSTYQVTVTGIDGAGSLRMDVLTDSYLDKAGNKGLGFMDGMSHTVERVSPELLFALTARGSTLTSGAAVVFDVRFSEVVIGLDATDFVLIADDTATATLSLVANDATSYTLTIDTIAGNGVIGLRLPASVYADTVGNDGLAYEASNLLHIDTSAPWVVSVAPQVDTSPNSRSVVFDVTYSEPVFNGIDTADFVLVATGSVSGRINCSF